ncbi:phospholipase/Carboxylesterase superfamily protein [Choiromyces venosus 120613-1]|uniref:Phospholipase/Carboxylesterase superfamily protein n=1 Tax=Choiromyces venosus 120613-1 TaxID=1336337 RepID=A0A3N4JTY9_9PEZI|nr:phospholipase/Carboxylesterase superfamily protein [Choiromyces venosus 120613-1]
MATTPTIPTKDNFPKSLVYTLPPPASTPPPTNILILMHGLGDLHNAFTALGTQLSLPETAVLSIQAPNNLPIPEEAYHWGDDVIFDNSTGGLDSDAGFTKTRALLAEIVDDTLVKQCGWRTRGIFFFGYAQGGMAALDFVLSRPDVEFGGVVSVGADAPAKVVVEAGGEAGKCKTPVIVCAAEKGSVVTEAGEKRLEELFEDGKVVRWKGRKDDGMMQNREELLPIMGFYGRRLGSVAGVPEGALELIAGRVS